MSHEAELVAAVQRCMMRSEGYCDAASTWDFMIGDPEGDYWHCQSCDEHKERIEAKYAVYDHHPISPCCGIPGTTWVFSKPDKPGRCIVEGLPEAVLTLGEAAPCPVNAGADVLVKL